MRNFSRMLNGSVSIRPKTSLRDLLCHQPRTHSALTLNFCLQGLQNISPQIIPPKILSKISSSLPLIVCRPFGQRNYRNSHFSPLLYSNNCHMWIKFGGPRYIAFVLYTYSALVVGPTHIISLVFIVKN